MRKILSLFLSIMMIFSIFCAAAFASGDVEYEASDGTASDARFPDNYEIISVGEDYYAVGIEYRDAEIFVTDISFEQSGDGKSIQIAPPTNAYLGGTEYILNFTNALKTYGGNGFKENKEMNFYVLY